MFAKALVFVSAVVVANSFAHANVGEDCSCGGEISFTHAFSNLSSQPQPIAVVLENIRSRKNGVIAKVVEVLKGDLQASEITLTEETTPANPECTPFKSINSEIGTKWVAALVPEGKKFKSVSCVAPLKVSKEGEELKAVGDITGGRGIVLPESMSLMDLKKAIYFKPASLACGLRTIDQLKPSQSGDRDLYAANQVANFDEKGNAALTLETVLQLEKDQPEIKQPYEIAVSPLSGNPEKLLASISFVPIGETEAKTVVLPVQPKDNIHGTVSITDQFESNLRKDVKIWGIKDKIFYVENSKDETLSLTLGQLKANSEEAGPYRIHSLIECSVRFDYGPPQKKQ